MLMTLTSSTLRSDLQEEIDLKGYSTRCWQGPPTPSRWSPSPGPKATRRQSATIGGRSAPREKPLRPTAGISDVSSRRVPDRSRPP